MFSRGTFPFGFLCRLAVRPQAAWDGYLRREPVTTGTRSVGLVWACGGLEKCLVLVFLQMTSMVYGGTRVWNLA